MIKKYLRNIVEKIKEETTSSTGLILLKWLIVHQYPYASHIHVNESIRKEMIESCIKYSIIEKKDSFKLTDYEYEKIIYDYAINNILGNIQKGDASDFDILLYIYAALTTPSGIAAETPSKFFLNAVISCVENDLMPEYRPKRELKTDRDIISDKSMSFPDCIIFVLYLWISDISVIQQYNEKKKLINMKRNNCTRDVIKDEDIWKVCMDSSSKYNYFFLKSDPGAENTKEKMKNIFCNYIMDIADVNYLFAPSLVTLLVNSLKPDIISHMDDCSNYNPNFVLPIDDDCSSFLKLVLLEPIINYNNSRKNTVNNRFNSEVEAKKRKLKKLNKNDYNKYLREYIDSLPDKDKTIAHDLFLSQKYKFYFSYSYFYIFLYIFENLEPPKSGKRMNFTLSLLHLNAATRWFDAFLLIKDMPYSFRNYDFLYLKMLSIIPKYRNIISILNDISVTVTDTNIIFEYEENKIQLENFMPLFYNKSEKKLNLERLVDILKAEYPIMSLKHILSLKEKEEITCDGINPVYKWIYSLDNGNISDEYLENICDSGYENFIYEKSYSDSSWETAKVVQDPYSDDYDIFEDSFI